MSSLCRPWRKDVSLPVVKLNRNIQYKLVYVGKTDDLITHFIALQCDLAFLIPLHF